MKTLQVIIFENDWDTEHSFGTQDIDESSLKRYGSFSEAGKLSPAEQDVVPHRGYLIFGDIDVSEGEKKTLQKWSTRARLEAFECVNDKVNVGVIWTHARGCRNAGAG